MLSFTEIRRSIEAVVDSLVKFLYSILGNWAGVAIRPFRTSLQLVRSPTSVGSETTLFLALLVFLSVVIPGENLGEMLQGAQTSRRVATTELDYRMVSGGIAGIVLRALLCYICWDVLFRLLAEIILWKRGLAFKRRAAVPMLRYGVSSGLVATCLIPELLYVLQLSYYFSEDDSARNLDIAYSVLLSTLCFYPVYVISLGLLHRRERNRQSFVRRFGRHVAVIFLVGALVFAFSWVLEGVGRLNAALFKSSSEAALQVEDLRCLWEGEAVAVEAVVRNRSDRPAFVDFDRLYVRVYQTNPLGRQLLLDARNPGHRETRLERVERQRPKVLAAHGLEVIEARSEPTPRVDDPGVVQRCELFLDQQHIKWSGTSAIIQARGANEMPDSVGKPAPANSQ